MPDTIGSAYVEILPDVERFIVELRAALNEAIGGRQSVDVAANVAGVSGLDRQIATEMATGAREGAALAEPAISGMADDTQGKMRDAVRNGMQQGAEEAAAERAFTNALTSGAQDALGALRILSSGVFQIFGGLAAFLNPGGSGGGAEITNGLNTIKSLFTQTASEAEAAGTSIAASWEVALPVLIAIAVPIGLLVASLGTAATLLVTFAAGLSAVAIAGAAAFGPIVALGAFAISLAGSGAFAKLSADFDQLHQHLQALAIPFATQIANQADQLLNTLAPLADQLATWFGPRLTTVLGLFSNFIGLYVIPALIQFATWYGRFIDSVIRTPEAAQMLGLLGDVLTGLLHALEVILPVLNSFASWFLDRWPELKRILGEIGASFAAGFDLKGVQDALKSFSDTLDYVSKHSSGLRAEMAILGFVFSTLIKIVVGVGTTFLEIAIILGDIGGIFSAVGDRINKIVTGIGGWFSWLGTQANNLNNDMLRAINSIHSGVVWLEGEIGRIFSGIGGWIQWLGARFSDLGTWANGAVHTVAGWFNWLGGAIAAAGGTIAGWINWIGQRFNDLGSFAATAVRTVVGFFAGLPGQLAGIFGGLAAAAAGWGASIVNGFVNGITGGFGRIAAAAQGMVNSLGSAVAGLLGLGSPSRLAQSWGEMVIQGFQLGLAGGLDMRALGPQIQGIRAQPTQVVNITVQAAQPTAADVAAALAWAQRTRQVGFALTPRVA